MLMLTILCLGVIKKRGSKVHLGCTVVWVIENTAISAVYRLEMTVLSFGGRGGTRTPDLMCVIHAL
jgi:hypothetical protein